MGKKKRILEDMYKEDLVCIARRENNQKRKYLVVNKLQGKHIPVSPKQAFRMFQELADMVKLQYPDEKLLLIGFAETATAIGAYLAVALNSYYMQTTREQIQGVEYLYFSESHSHATEQKLVKTDLDKVINKVDRIVFVEDEVTTGNTILNIVNLMEAAYPGNLKFAAASLLNGMNAESEKIYAKRKIQTLYLVKTAHDAYSQLAERYKGDGIYHPFVPAVEETEFLVNQVPGYVDARRLTIGIEYKRACEKLWDAVKKDVEIKKDKKTLVVGTEEFMYPALFVAEKIEEGTNLVRCHSTTRSPITVSTEEEYPVHERYELKSLYDSDRRTFIYDIGTYGQVLIITDAAISHTGLASLVQALRSRGNTNIKIVRWY